MKQFIHLSSRIINKAHIVEILKTPNKYTLYMSNSYMSGHFMYIYGFISTKDNIIEICEKKNKQDYDIITKTFWNSDIKTLNKN